MSERDYYALPTPHLRWRYMPGESASRPRLWQKWELLNDNDECYGEEWREVEDFEED